MRYFLHLKEGLKALDGKQVRYLFSFKTTSVKLSSLQPEHLGEVVGLLVGAGVLHRSSADLRLLPGTGDRVVGYRQIALAVLGGEEAGQQV